MRAAVVVDLICRSLPELDVLAARSPGKTGGFTLSLANANYSFAVSESFYRAS
jgi:hypothetical protein